MYIGSLTARLLVRDSRTLKDKRQVVRSILDKARAGFGVAAAEVGGLDDVKVADLAFAAVGPEAALVRGVLQKLADALRRHPVAEYLGGDLTVGHEVV
jgi:uncharacterized protein YlxP (DUF503 family)